MGIGLLLEGFAAGAAPDPLAEVPFAAGDHVRVSVKGRSSIVGRVVRGHGGPPATHAVIAPEGGGAHVLAPVEGVKLNTPAQHAAMQRRRDAADARQQGRRSEPGRVGVPKLPASGSTLEGLLEAFSPPESPAQSQQIGVGQIAAANASLRAGWNASKHPRAAGGKFGYTTGGKRARSTTTSGKTLNTGSSGALVKSIQRQLGLPSDGIYGPSTKAAVVRFQQQHGLLVDGIVGRQTLAALRGQKQSAPGPIGTKQTRLSRSAKSVKATKATKVPVAPGRLGGGVVV